MFKAILISFSFLIGSNASSLRIVNGTNASPGEFPFAVSLRRNLYHTCGATILNENFVLTAAHCACSNNQPANSSDYTIQYGSINISADYNRSIQVKEIYCNKFNRSTLLYDAAVLELETAIPSSDDNWTAVKLAKEFNTSIMQNGVIIGWGRLSHTGSFPRTLQKLNVDIYPDSICGLVYTPEHHICFGADVGGACNGDSGTALISNGLQIGIASFITTICGTATTEFPNVYSRVSRYYEWVANIAGLD